MKKFKFLLPVFFICGSLSAQLYVDPNSGNVSIKSNLRPQSALSINSAGDPDYKLYVSTENGGIRAERRTVAPTLHSHLASFSVFSTSSTYNSGVIGSIWGNSPSSGRAYGIIGRAGNATSGYNFGIYGHLTGTQNGAGIYATADTNNEYGEYISGRYAGFFRGNVYVSGNIYGRLLTSSAVMSSQNLRSLSDQLLRGGETVTDKINQLNVVQYGLKSPEEMLASRSVNTGDTVEIAPALSPEDLQALEKPHYGLVAQELKEIYPELVYENSEGELGINYIEMVPLLIQSIQELTTKINVLEAQNATQIESIGKVEETLLFQNTPNPFNQDTEISFALPESVQNASLYIYNMNGTQIDQIPLSQRGKASVILKGKTLTAGMYIYTLIADNKVVDSKRMILTK